MEVQSLAQNGLAYSNNVYDIERYERLREISIEMLCLKSDLSFYKLKELFCNNRLSNSKVRYNSSNNKR